MSGGLVRGGSLGIFFTADDNLPAAAPPPDEEERVSLITGTAPPQADVMTPGAPPKARVMDQNMDFTGLALGIAAIAGIYFLLSK
jgi:hypothetical protein